MPAANLPSILATKLFFVAGLKPKEPTTIERFGVNDSGVYIQVFVNGNDLTGNRCKYI